MTAKWGRKSVILFYASVRGLLTLNRQKYGLYTDGESYHRTNGRLMWLRLVLIIEINRLVKRAFDVAGRESSSCCGDSSGDENMLQ